MHWDKGIQGMKIKVEKIKLNDSGNWNAFNELRKSAGVKEVLKEAAQEIGEIETEYDGLTRHVVVVKTDIDTYNRLVAEGKIIPKGTNDE